MQIKRRRKSKQRTLLAIVFIYVAAGAVAFVAMSARKAEAGPSVLRTLR